MTARRKTLTDAMTAKLKPQATRYTVPDPECRGHYVRVASSGAKSYCAVARSPDGAQVWATIGSTNHHKIEDARERARDAIKRIKAGLPAFAPAPTKPDTFKEVAENYVQRHVKAKGLRSKDEIERILRGYAYPAWQDREFIGIRRGDVTKLLDDVQDANGPRQADYLLAVVRGIMNWHASRTDDYTSPITRGMRRTDPVSRKRARILDDDELRIVWRIAETNGAFGAIMRLALLTAQRREKIAAMRWDDVTVDGVWSIPADAREKGNGGELVLPDAALTIIRAQKRMGNNSYIFPGRVARGRKVTEGHFNGFSPSKRAFDEKLATARREEAAKRGGDPDKVKDMPAWTLHDLRRTARSLMSRAGVRPDIAERVMGHAIAGVEGVYDRHSYRDQKADALKKLAGLVELICNPPAGNVVEIVTPRGAVALR